MKRPEIQWLEDNWSLPKTAAPLVEKLLEAEALGSTACVLEEGVDFGTAASRPEENAPTPLVLVKQDGREYLQSRRLFAAEQAIARKLATLAAEKDESSDQKELACIFPGATPGDRQMLAAASALRRRLTVITGGPGTGKTYTIARILALLVVRGIDPADIALSAPTGKAADRMRAAVTASLDTLPKNFPVAGESLAKIAASSRTLHSLLGHHPGKGTCEFNGDNRLP